MIPCKYDEKQHQILPSEISRWCVRNAPADWKDRLFTYRHRIHGTFVVAVWADKNRRLGLFSDVLNLGDSLNNFDHKKADELMRRMWAPLSPSSMADQINQQSRDYNSRQQDINEELKDNQKRRKRDFK